METINCKNVCRCTLEVKKAKTSTAKKDNCFFFFLSPTLAGVSRTWDIC